MKQQARWIRLYFPLCHFLVADSSSPLLGSLTKLKLHPERWLHILNWPLAFNEQTLRDLAKEAREQANALHSLAAEAARSSFDEAIAQSLEEGSAFLHKC